MDAELLKECADPSLKPAVIEQFIDQAGSTDPLAISVTSDGRRVLVPRPRSPEEAMAIVRDYVGKAVVRVGITQYPAGVGVTDVSEIDDDLVEPCSNLRNGTAMFAKIMRIVARWYGDPKEEDKLPQIFDDAVVAWQTGEFHGIGVFQAEDPHPVKMRRMENAGNEKQARVELNDGSAEVEAATGPSPKAQAADQPDVDVEKPDNAGIRINLSHIGVGQP